MYPESEDRNAYSRQPGSSFDNGAPKQQKVRPDEAGRWGVEPSPQGRKDMIDSFHGQQQPYPHPYPQQHPSMPPQHQPHFTHGQAQWSNVSTPSQEHTPNVYQNGMGHEAPAQSATVGAEHGEAGLTSANGTATKAKVPKVRNKPKGVKISSEHDKAEVASGPLSSASERSNDLHQQFSPLQDQGGDSMVSGDKTQIKPGRGKGKKPPPQPAASSEPHGLDLSGARNPGTLARPRSSKPDEGLNDRAPPPENGTGPFGASSGGHERVSMRLGSGMILVSEGSGQFPPARLSIRTARDFSAAGEPSSSTLNSPSTPMSANSVKKKRPRLQLEDKDPKVDVTPGSPKQPHSAKSDHAPLSPPPPPPSRGKSNYRSRKGAVSTDADIERSNEITRLSGPGPSWMIQGSTNASSSGNGQNNNNNIGTNINGAIRSSTPIAGGATKAGDSSSISTSNAAVRRRPLVPPSVISAEIGGRKPKRIKIEEKDVRQDQRLAEDGNERDNEDEDVMEGEEDDEALEEGDRESGDTLGVRKRRSPGDDDEDLGDDDTGAAGGGGSGSNANGNSNGQSRGSGGMGGRKSMKRKSNGDLSNSGSNKKLNKSKGASMLSPDAFRTMGDFTLGPFKNATNGTACNDQPRKSNADSKDLKESDTGAGIESETEIDYLPMEDDPECPHMFGIGESDKEKDSFSEDDAEDEDDTLLKDEAEMGSKSSGATFMSKKIGPGQKGMPSEMPDDIQKKGRDWVGRLAMPESAWVSCRCYCCRSTTPLLLKELLDSNNRHIRTVFLIVGGVVQDV